MPTKKVTAKVNEEKVIKAKVNKPATKAKVATTKPKVAKKAVKASPKPRTSKALLKPVRASEENSFWVADGQILDDLAALRNALISMEDHIYHYHVSPEENDFADWVDMVLLDADTAEALRDANTQMQALEFIIEALTRYEF